MWDRTGFGYVGFDTDGELPVNSHTPNIISNSPCESFNPTNALPPVFWGLPCCRHIVIANAG